MTDTLSTVLAEIDKGRDAAIARLFGWLAIPSISMDPANDGDCDRAARWCADELTGLGFEASVRPSGGHPMVVAHRMSKQPGAQHVLFYGHYDVQPVDPLDLWHRPPFEPYLGEDAVNGSVIFARGASDDKGQVMTFLDAVRAWIAVTGDVPLSLTVLIEGDEESDSAHLEAFLKQHAGELRQSLALVCDSGAWDRATPAITMGLRGYAGAEITVSGPTRDLHSGRFGGAAVNPIRALAHILDGLHDEAGRVQIPGFYDGVSELTPAMRNRWQRLGFDPEAFLASVGLRTPSGERGRSVLELVWARPTAEVNGIWGGYQGPGMKTVIPAEASAKLSFRLVPGQDPAAVLGGFERLARSRLMSDCRLTITPADGTPAVAVAEETPFIAPAAKALEAEWGRPAALINSGGSIPIVSAFKGLLGMDALMVGFAQVDDNVHSPNEKYNLTSLIKGTRSWARIIDGLSRARLS